MVKIDIPMPKTCKDCPIHYDIYIGVHFLMKILECGHLKEARKKEGQLARLLR